MSIWTSDIKAGRSVSRPAFWLPLVLVMPLAGCLSPSGDGAPKGRSAGAFSFLTPQGEASRDANKTAGKVQIRHSKPMRQLSLAEGDVVISTPQGFCIDPESIQKKRGGGFALMASCAALTGKSDGVVVDPALLTVSVSPRKKGLSQPDAHKLASMIEPGKTLQRINGDGLTLIHVQDSQHMIAGKSDERHWRGVMVINEHLVGVAAYGPENSKVVGADGKVLVVQLAEAIREASPFRDTPVPVSQAVENGAGSTQKNRDAAGPAVAKKTSPDQPGLKKLIGRLFP